MNIQITDLRALDGDSLVAVHVLILFEDGARDSRVYHILPEQYGALRLRVGEIGCETVDALEEAATLCAAIRKGTSLLSYGAQSEKTMRQKLRARGFAPEVAAAAAALEAFKGELLADHIRTCVLHDVKAGNEETVEELIETLRRIR